MEGAGRRVWRTSAEHAGKWEMLKTWPFQGIVGPKARRGRVTLEFKGKEPSRVHVQPPGTMTRFRKARGSPVACVGFVLVRFLLLDGNGDRRARSTMAPDYGGTAFGCRLQTCGEGGGGPAQWREWSGWGQEQKEEEGGTRMNRGGMSQLWEGRARLDQEPGLGPEPSAKPPVLLPRS